MQVTFTLPLEEFAERYRRRVSALPYVGTPPLDTSEIEIRTDQQIQRALVFMGQMNRFEVNRWFSFVSWSRDTGDPNTIRIVVEGTGPQFDAVCQAIAADLRN